MAIAGDKSALLVKKLAGLALVVFGLLLAGYGFSSGVTWVGTVGVVLLIAGIVLLVLKIVRRNQPD
jgi:uncharacterized membrane protein HdeD (DUF308 family)